MLDDDIRKLSKENAKFFFDRRIQELEEQLRYWRQKREEFLKQEESSG